MTIGTRQGEPAPQSPTIKSSYGGQSPVHAGERLQQRLTGSLETGWPGDLTVAAIERGAQHPGEPSLGTLGDEEEVQGAPYLDAEMVDQERFNSRLEGLRTLSPEAVSKIASDTALYIRAIRALELQTRQSDQAGAGK